MNAKKFLTSVFFCLMSLYSNAQCSSFKIIADKSSICAPDIIRFQVQNPVAGSTYEWNLGNGIIYGADTLYRFFTSSGTINASVKITLPSGTVCNIVENGIAVVNAIPKPQFSTPDVKLCNGPGSINLTDITPNSATRSWVVDGTNYSNSGTSISHNFITTGVKKISLIVIDSNGCKGVKEFLDTIQVYSKPIFDFAADVTSGCAPKTVSYSISSNPSVAPYTKSFTWLFQGISDSLATGSNPTSRIYSAKGSYNATLSVEVTNGCSYDISKSSLINLGDTVNLGLYASNSSVCSNVPVTFFQTNSLLTNALSWNFSGVLNSLVFSSNDSAKIIATTTGNVNVSLSYDDNGCLSTKNFPDIVSVNGVRADFNSPDHFHCLVPHTVHLVNLSDTLDATSLSYKWRILNGNSEVFISSLFNPNFTFTTMPASYDVQLIALGDNGCSDTLTRSSYIYQEPLDVLFSVQPSKVCVGQEFSVTNATKPGSYQVVDSFKWYFFDKNDIDILDSSFVKFPNYSYSDTGFYDILGIAYNDLGCQDTLRITDVIEVISPKIDFEIPNPIVCLGYNILLYGKSTPIDAGFTYDWDFTNLESGQHFLATGDSTSLYTTQVGEYKAKFTHSISHGCVSSDSMSIFVNGISAEIVLDTNSGCAPLTVNPTANILTNYHFGETSDSVTYQWSVSPDSGVISNGLSTSTPNFTFEDNGDYEINLIVTNSAGCSFISTSTKILSGVRAGFGVVDSKICFGDTLLVSDYSYNGVTNVQWDLRPTANYSVTTDLDFVRIIIDEPGSYELRQVVTNNNNCFDTAYQAFDLIGVVADFAAVDSFLQCAPVYAEFQSLSSNADTLIWDFGAGDIFKTTSTSAGTIYSKNSGWSEGYDISLIAKNIEGCSDTAYKLDYMVVAGPTPLFEMTDFEGCEPLNVTFIDKSRDEARFFMNYNDGSQLDSSKVMDLIGVHSYTVTAFGALSQKIMPSIIVYDSLGCAAVYEPEDSITVYRSPSALAEFPNGTENCSPFNIVFADTGSFVDNRTWFLDGTVISSNKEDSIVKTGSNVHDLQLIVTNSNNCKDTLEQSISVFEKPDVSFTISDTICINQVNTYLGSFAISTPVNNFTWNFGEPSNPENINTSDLTVNFTYLTKGTKDISFVGGLSNGCSDTAMKSIVITDETSIDNPIIKYVTFTDNYELEIAFEKSSTSKFFKYEITNGVTIDNVFDVNTTKLKKTFGSIPTSIECYSLRVGDYCDLMGLTSTSHCFIALTVTSAKAYENELIWTPYQGWSSVKEYTIYRKDENDVFVKIGAVDGNTTSFIDKGLCDQNYEYYIQASHPLETWISNSYKVTNRPIYILNPLPTSVRNVSVVGENQIEINWNPSTFSEFESYNLIKYETDFNTLISSTRITSNSYVDAMVNTNSKSYIYQVTEVDRCGYSNTPEREGKSILLKGYYNEGGNLGWTEYKNWSAGVKQYNVEIDLKNGFEQTHINSGTDRDYVDKKFYRDVPGEYCYRVFAVSGDTKDTSYSNVICLIGEPKALLPNAFTPNKDGLNEKFNPIVQFIKQGDNEEINSFNFSIYNRWGEKIYETDRFDEGWDGTYKGVDCPQGTFIYQLTVSGLNDKRINMKGSITLLR